DAEVVHWVRTGQGPQVPSTKVITIVSVPRWATRSRQLLAWPCGQVACRASKSMANAARSNPAPALACGEVPASVGGGVAGPGDVDLAAVPEGVAPGAPPGIEVIRRGDAGSARRETL